MSARRHRIRHAWLAIVCLIVSTSVHAQIPRLLIDLGTQAALDNLSDISGRLFFAGSTPATGSELMASDGTPAGTGLVADIYPGTTGSQPIWFADLDGIALFRAWGTDAYQGYELWRSDGTAAGTWLVKDISPNGHSLPTHLTFFDGRVYFSANGPDGQELWVSDGTADGTYQRKDINQAGSGAPSNLTVVGDRLFFRASDGVHGMELWLTDGTEIGTVMVKDIHPTASSNPALLTAVGDALFFVADDGVHGQELWRSDGTEAGTVLVKDIRPGIDPSAISSVVAHQGLLYFSANDGVHDVELWRSDGTADGTWMVKNINPTGSSLLVNMASAGGLLYFAAASTFLTGRELWRSDGTADGTWMVKDIQPGSTGSQPYAFTEFGNLVYFIADDGVHGQEPWVTDGTAQGTRLLQDFVPGAGHSCQATQFVVSGGLLFFNTLGLNEANQTTKQLWAVDPVSSSVGPETGTPAAAALAQNHPNPFNPATVIRYETGIRTRVSLDIFDARGYHIRRLVDDTKGPGTFAATWDGLDSRGQNVPGGLYVYRLSTGDASLTRKMVLLR